MFLGYNTNGLAHHDLFDAVELLAEIGYRGVAITIDHNALPPYGKHTSQRITRLRRLLERLDMRSVIETGARFLLDPRAKHEPTLLSAGRRRRIDFYKYAVDCAAQLQSDCVSLWSGVAARAASTRRTGHGSAGRRARRSARLCRAARRPDRFRARAGDADRLDAGVRGAVDSDRRPQPASDARHRPSSVSGRDADRRGDPPLGAAAR